MKTQDINKLNILFFAIALSVFNLTIAMEEATSFDIPMGHNYSANGVDIEAGRDKDLDLSALLRAVMYGNIDKVNLLILEGVDVNLIDGNGNTALMWAVQHSHISKDIKDIVKLLLAVDADVDLQDYNGNTALMWAVRCKCMDEVRLLIEYGADINIQDNSGKTALIWAALRGHKDIVKLLLATDADVNLQDINCGQTALTWAVRWSTSKDIVELLLLAGADVHIRDNYGNTALKYALLANNYSIIGLFQEGTDALTTPKNDSCIIS